jgi:predicted regulator of Ras-like GTPase activity (Roadblock/LC7/MglB family)
MSIDLKPEQKHQLVRILKQISLGCDLEALAVVNTEGLKIAFFSEKGKVDPDLMSALASAMNSTGEMVAEQLKHGGIELVLVRGEKGFTILSNADNYILIGASVDLTNTGLALQVMRRYVPDIIEILSD